MSLRFDSNPGSQMAGNSRSSPFQAHRRTCSLGVRARKRLVYVAACRAFEETSSSRLSGAPQGGTPECFDSF